MNYIEFLFISHLLKSCWGMTKYSFNAIIMVIEFEINLLVFIRVAEDCAFYSQRVIPRCLGIVSYRTFKNFYLLRGISMKTSKYFKRDWWIQLATETWSSLWYIHTSNLHLYFPVRFLNCICSYNNLPSNSRCSRFS